MKIPGRASGFAAAAAVFILTGCASSGVGLLGPTATASPLCTQPQCNYTIKVVSCNKDGIVPEFDEIHVGKGPHRLHWVIISPGYTFDVKGIGFPGNPPEFTDGKRVTLKEFSWTDNNSVPQGAPPKPFKYDVRILDASGAVCLYDPSIVNE